MDTANNGSLVEYFREVHSNTRRHQMVEFGWKPLFQIEPGTIEYETDEDQNSELQELLMEN